MKKLVAFAAVIAAVSFTSCGNKSAQTTETAAETVVVEEVATEVAPADSTVTEAAEAPAETPAAE